MLIFGINSYTEQRIMTEWQIVSSKVIRLRAFISNSGISGFNVQYVKVCADTDGKYYISVTASMNDSDGLSFMDSFRYDIG